MYVPLWSGLPVSGVAWVAAGGQFWEHCKHMLLVVAGNRHGDINSSLLPFARALSGDPSSKNQEKELAQSDGFSPKLKASPRPS